MQVITISQDGHWAGDGWIDAQGTIQDCPAVLGPEGLAADDGSQQDAADRAYAAIEDALRSGQDNVTVDGCRYSWALRDVSWCPLCGQHHAPDDGPAGYSCERGR